MLDSIGGNKSIQNLMEGIKSHINQGAAWIGRKIVQHEPENAGPTTLKICALCYKFLAKLSSNKDQSQTYSAQESRIKQQLRQLNYSKNSQFGENLVKGALNIAKKEVIQGDLARPRAESLVKKTLELPNTEGLKEIKRQQILEGSTNKDKEIKTKRTDGICMGISLDLAKRFLIDEESPDQLINSLVKGGTMEAEANQAAASVIAATRSEDPATWFLNMFKVAQSVVTGNDGLFKSNPDRIKNLFTSIWNAPKERNNFPPPNLELKDNAVNLEFSEWMPRFYLFGQVDKEPKGLASWFVKNPDNKMPIDFAAFKSAALEHIDQSFNKQIQLAKENPEINVGNLLKARNEKILEVRWAVSLLELNFLLASQKQELVLGAKPSIGGKSLSDRELNQVILGSFHKLYIDRARVEAVALARGVKMIPMEDKMGSSILKKDDGAYLDNFSKLDSGFYTMSFNVGPLGGHVISVIKENDGSGYIIDPNHNQIKFKNSDEAVQFLKNVVNQYPAPESSGIVDSYHQIHMYKCEKLVT